MRHTRLIAILVNIIIGTAALLMLARCGAPVAPDPTVSQYVDAERGVVCYTYGQGISCVRDAK